MPSRRARQVNRARAGVVSAGAMTGATSRKNKDKNAKIITTDSKAAGEGIPHASQSTVSDDGIPEALVQKLQFGLERKKKDKEIKYLTAYQKELTDIQMSHRMEFNECCDEIDRAYEAFLLEYAKMEDHIRALWVKVMKTFQPYIDQAQEQINTEKEVEKLREKEQNLGLRYHKKGNEDYHKLISTLLEEVNIKGSWNE